MAGASWRPLTARSRLRWRTGPRPVTSDAMIVSDSSRLPLLLVVVIGPAHAESTLRTQAAWRDLLQAGSPFAALQLFLDDAAAAQQGSGDDLAAWLADQPAAQPGSLWAIARVSLASGAAPAGLPACPAAGSIQDFADVLSALHWLRETAFTPRALPLPLEATASALAGMCWEADV